MKRSVIKQISFWLIVCFSLMLGLASCGSDETPTPAPTVAPTAAPTTAPTATQAPATATTAPQATVSQPVTKTASSTTTVNVANAQPQSPLAAPQSPLAMPQSPLPGPASSTQPTSTKPISGTQANAAPQGNAPIHVISGFATISEIAKTTKAETPATGKASLSGVLYNSDLDRVVPGNIVYLTPALVDGDKASPPSIFVGARPEHGDVPGKSNEKGQIFLKDIPPGKYYLVVWEPLDWYLAFESAKTPAPKLITLTANQKLDLGLLYPRGG